jgi:hypothetical protein
MSMLFRSSSDTLHGTEVLKFSAPSATKLLKLKPFKTPAAHELQPLYPSKRGIFWCQEWEQSTGDYFQDLL